MSTTPCGKVAPTGRSHLAANMKGSGLLQLPAVVRSPQHRRHGRAALQRVAANSEQQPEKQQEPPPQQPATPQQQLRDERQQAAAQSSTDSAVIYGVGLGLTVATVGVLRLAGGADALGGGEAGFLGGDGFGPGDAAGAALWACSLYFVSPLQLLLLFLGRIDVDRPSDWLSRLLGLAAGLPVDDIAYEAPASVRSATLAACGAGGVAVAAASSALLGDSSWSVATGIGACMAAGLMEVGRPARLSSEEAQALERDWQEFAGFAEQRLQRGGRCHDSEVMASLRRERRRLATGLPPARLKEFVVNWSPDARRTSAGYWTGVSLKPYVDPFTGQTTGKAGPK